MGDWLENLDIIKNIYLTLKFCLLVFINLNIIFEIFIYSSFI